MPRYCLLTGALIATLMGVGQACAATVVMPTNALIQYLGRFDRRMPAAPRFDWPATTIRARFGGNSIGVILSNSTDMFRFRAFIDDAPVPDVVCDRRGAHTYLIQTGLSNTAHILELVKKNEEDRATPTTCFLGFVLDDGAALLPCVDPSPRRILCVGASFSAGYGAGYAGAPRAASNHTEKLQTDDAWLAYGPQLARKYHAEYQLIARSGIGVYCTATTLQTNHCMRARIGQTLVADPTLSYNFAEFVPQLVTIQLGGNDFASWAKTGTPTQAQFERAYHELLDVLMRHYSNAAYVLLSQGKPAPWHAYVKNVAAARGCAYAHMTGPATELGLDRHPTARGQSNIAARLGAVIDGLPVPWPDRQTNCAAPPPLCPL